VRRINTSCLLLTFFSRFVFLRPLKTKESAEVAEQLLLIYSEHAPPNILQSDQGTEFKGVVKTLCESLNVRIIKSAAYHPQSQGKDERSHRTWKEKMKFDMLNSCNGDLNWVEYLPMYQQLYNESPHGSLGLLTPFEVYFGRPVNRLHNKLFIGEKKDFEVEEEEDVLIGNERDKDTPADDLCELANERDIVRQKALDASTKAAQRMIKRELKRNPPSLYHKGEVVLLRLPVARKSVKGKKTSLRSNCEGLILESDHILHKYRIEYEDPLTSKLKKNWFKVDDITSLTKDEENTLVSGQPRWTPLLDLSASNPSNLGNPS